MATNPAYIPLTVEEFFEFDFPSDKKLELVDGVIVAMAGGSRRHAEVQANIQAGLFNRLRGSGCKPFGPDMGIRTSDYSVRYPDVTVLCGLAPDLDDEKASLDPVVVFEVLSPSTAANDQGAKLLEYRALPSVQTIVFVDPMKETLRVVQRAGPYSWHDEDQQGDVGLPSLGITLPRAEIFARD